MNESKSTKVQKYKSTKVQKYKSTKVQEATAKLCSVLKRERPKEKYKNIFFPFALLKRGGKECLSAVTCGRVPEAAAACDYEKLRAASCGCVRPLAARCGRVRPRAREKLKMY